MNYDKVTSTGTVIKAPAFTYRVLESVPVLFHLAEWLVVIVAFQYADVRFGFIAAKIVWVLLALAFALYFGVLVSNVAWRVFEDPYKNRAWRFFMSAVLPAACGILIFLFLHFVVKQMVAAHA